MKIVESGSVSQRCGSGSVSNCHGSATLVQKHDFLSRTSDLEPENGWSCILSRNTACTLCCRNQYLGCMNVVDVIMLAGHHLWSISKSLVACRQCLGSGFTESWSGSSWAFFWIRVQAVAESGSRPRFCMYCMKKFLIENRHNLLSKDINDSEEASSHTENSWNMKFLLFSPFLRAILACLDPDSKSGSGSTDPFDSGSKSGSGSETLPVGTGLTHLWNWENIFETFKDCCGYVFFFFKIVFLM